MPKHRPKYAKDLSHRLRRSYLIQSIAKSADYGKFVYVFQVRLALPSVIKKRSALIRACKRHPKKNQHPYLKQANPCDQTSFQFFFVLPTGEKVTYWVHDVMVVRNLISLYPSFGSGNLR